MLRFVFFTTMFWTITDDTDRLELYFQVPSIFFGEKKDMWYTLIRYIHKLNCLPCYAASRIKKKLT
jgi:hypothetical protein